MNRRKTRLIAVVIALVVALGSAVPTFASSKKPSYYPYKSAAAKKHAQEMAFKNLEKNSSKTKSSSTNKITSNTTKKTTTTKASSSGKYLNVNEAYTLLNNFRTSRNNQWYWNSNNRTKTYTYGLKALKKDASLEKIAKTRAEEQWRRYYVQGKTDHTRPNGRDCKTAYPTSAKYAGENLAWGQTSCKEVILHAKWGWAEPNDKYSGQGHRRNMLNKSATRVGIACYEKDGKKCWAMCLGY